MELTPEDIRGLNVALNEAKLLGVEFDPDREIVAATVSPIALDEAGKVPTDNRVQLVFSPVGRLIASYRLGRWNDEHASVVGFEPDQLFQKVSEFGGCPIYGWEFIDSAKASDANWENKLSCKFESPQAHGRQHTITLFQASATR